MQTQNSTQTFKDWMIETYEPSEISDMSTHGVDGGFHGLIWTTECAALFDQHQDEIWELVTGAADDQGVRPGELISSFGRSDMAEGTFDQFKNLLVWFAAEHYAYEISENISEYFDTADEEVS